jgi:hypothetical protein
MAPLLPTYMNMDFPSEMALWPIELCANILA